MRRARLLGHLGWNIFSGGSSEHAAYAHQLPRIPAAIMRQSEARPRARLHVPRRAAAVFESSTYRRISLKLGQPRPKLNDVSASNACESPR